jgi:hypothetical protein
MMIGDPKHMPKSAPLVDECSLENGARLSQFSKSGILWKKSSRGGLSMGTKKWKRRFFVLDFIQVEGVWDTRFAYHSVERSVRGVDEVAFRTIELAKVEFRMLQKDMQQTPEKQLQFCLFHGDTRCYELRAENQTDLNEWRTSLGAAISLKNAAPNASEEAFDLDDAASLNASPSQFRYTTIASNPTKNKQGRVGGSKNYYPVALPIPNRSRSVSRDDFEITLLAGSSASVAPTDPIGSTVSAVSGSASVPTRTRKLGEGNPGSTAGSPNKLGWQRPDPGSIKGQQLKSLFAAQRRSCQIEKQEEL